MQALVLISTPRLSLVNIASQLSDEWGRHIHPNAAGNQELSLQGENYDWYINITQMKDAGDIEADYMQWDELDDELRKSLKGRTFFLISFNNYFIMRKLLPDLLRVLPGELLEHWVDTDHGVIVRADRFLWSLQNKPIRGG